MTDITLAPTKLVWSLEGLERAYRTLQAWRRRSRERNELARMSSRELSDIGISRPLAMFEAHKPFWRS